MPSTAMPRRRARSAWPSSWAVSDAISSSAAMAPTTQASQTGVPGTDVGTVPATPQASRAPITRTLQSAETLIPAIRAIGTPPLFTLLSCSPGLSSV